MDDREVRRFDAYTRGDTFCLDNAADFAPTSDFHTHYAQLGVALGNVTNAHAGQLGGGTGGKAGILDAIRIDCRNIRRTATTIAQDEPGFADDFPAAEHNDTSVIATADAYLKNFEPAPGDSAEILAAKAALTARFVAKELPADFVTTLRADRDSYGPATQAQESKRRGKVEDTQGITDWLGEAGKQIRYLDAIMNNKYTRDAEKLRGWKSAIHIERGPKKKPGDDQSGGATPKA
ncbi:MAG TPA: hypothetical protein VHW03_04590 [Chthoniobacterales bacterium]|jgi:hypothetical protein|nr:hypothetical protein [Chthoniobacterales bacterium]